MPCFLGLIANYHFAVNIVLSVNFYKRDSVASKIAPSVSILLLQKGLFGQKLFFVIVGQSIDSHTPLTLLTATVTFPRFVVCHTSQVVTKYSQKSGKALKGSHMLCFWFKVKAIKWILVAIQLALSSSWYCHILMTLINVSLWYLNICASLHWLL